MKCIICETENSEKGKTCKLCGMKADEPLDYMRFFFCCEKCVRHFKSIVENAPIEERIKIMERDILI